MRPRYLEPEDELRSIIRAATRHEAEAAVARCRLAIPRFRQMVRYELGRVRGGRGNGALLGIAWHHYRDQQRALRLWSRKLEGEAL